MDINNIDDIPFLEPIPEVDSSSDSDSSSNDDDDNQSSHHNSGSVNHKNKVDRGKKGVEEDFEDPEYWKKVNSNVIKKLRAGNSSVEFYKEALANSHCLLTKYQAELKKLQELATGNSSSANPGGSAARSAVISNGHGIREKSVFKEAQKGKDAISIFPEEVWGMILGNVNDGKDLENCSNSCKLFEQILSPQKPQWLFGRVFPFLYNYLEKKEILNCRKVCKHWMAGVDHRIDNVYWDTAPAGRTPNNSVDAIFHNFTEPFAVYKFRSSNQQEEDEDAANNRNRWDDDGEDGNRYNPKRLITLEMRHHKRNPFLSRAVSIVDVSTTPQSPLLRELLEFLETSGQHIWYLKIRRGVIGNNLRPILKNLNECLQKTPNLKMLVLTLESIMIPQNLPNEIIHCPSLETLIIRSLCSETRYKDDIKTNYATLFLSILSRQLVRFEVGFWTPRLIEFQWPKLRELSLHKVGSVQTLHGLLKINLPALQNLEILFSDDFKCRPAVLLELLLRISNHFECLSSMYLGNLPDFNLTSQDLAGLPDALYAPKRLACLMIASLVEHPQGPIPFSFLVRFPFLKYLYVSGDCHQTNWNLFKQYWNSDITGIYKASFEKQMHKAAIWKMLPNLQVLACELGPLFHDGICVAYTRQGHVIKPGFKIESQDEDGNDHDFSDDEEGAPELVDVWRLDH